MGNAYASVGQQRQIDSPGAENPWLALFGSLAFPTGEGVYTLHAHKRSLELCEHLQQLIALDAHAFWFVSLDNASAHTTSLVQDFAQQHQERLELIFLPTYSPHRNFIERLWRLLRLQVTRKHFYPSLTHLTEAVVGWLQQLSFAQFCSLIGSNDAHLAFVDKPFF